MSKKEKIYIAPEAFDYIHLMSLEYGGIGAGRNNISYASEVIPLCLYGMIVDEYDRSIPSLHRHLLSQNVRACADLPESTYGNSNDSCGRRLNSGKYDFDARVPFIDLALEMGLDVDETLILEDLAAPAAISSPLTTAQLPASIHGMMNSITSTTVV